MGLWLVGSWVTQQQVRKLLYQSLRDFAIFITATQIVTSYRFTNGHGSPTWTNFGCIGNESALVDCSYNTGVCGAYNTITAMFAIVGLKCEGDVAGMFLMDGPLQHSLSFPLLQVIVLMVI